VGRAPAFVFDTLESACLFSAWAAGQIEEFRRAAQTTTQHGRLLDMRLALEGNHVYLYLDFSTGDAAGQNMVTFAADAICRYIEKHSPVTPRQYFIEGNFSGDKKASALSFLGVRGKKVSAEVVVAKTLVEHRLRTTPADLVRYWQMAAVGGIMSGTIGIQGHFANGLAALYLACGQDAACVAESAVGVTRFECTEDGSLYASVTLPNVIVGTVGGGTGLPSQNACLRLMGLEGAGHARALAEVCAALCLAGELSICGALCAGDFARAHMHLARPHK
jgi:hydroxymethylglutaryl-CoA reductase (NADPH)